jgi:hypothetical protein
MLAPINRSGNRTSSSSHASVKSEWGVANSGEASVRPPPTTRYCHSLFANLQIVGLQATGTSR